MMPTGPTEKKATAMASRCIGILAVCILVGVTVGACRENSSAADRLAEHLRTGRAFTELALTEPESHCAAQAIVDDLGTEQVHGLGLDDPDTEPDFTALPTDALTSVASGVDGCVDRLDAVLTSTIAKGILDRPDETLPVDRDAADCVGQALVDGLGAPQLLVLGALSGGADPINAGSMSDDEVDTVADAFLGCLDIRQVFQDQFAAQGLPDDTAACLARKIPEQNLHDLFAAQFAGEAVDPNSLLGPALGACGLA